MFRPAGKEYTTLLDEMITLSIKEYKERCKKTYSFDTNILSMYNGLKGGKGMKNKINIKKVAALNDNLRKTFTGGRVLLTIGFRSLPEDEQAEVLQKVRAFNDFTPDNDPFGEHDFGSITSSRGTQVFWKIDLYDINDEFYSPQPDDPTQTNRVMTILLSEEY